MSKNFPILKSISSEQMDEWKMITHEIIHSSAPVDEKTDPFEYYVERIKKQFQQDEEFIDRLMHGYVVLLTQISADSEEKDS